MREMAWRRNPDDMPERRGLFPLQAETVRQALEHLNQDSEALLRLIVEARSHGAADTLYVNLVADKQHHLEGWHEARGDFSQNGEFYYRLGLLYGKDTAQHIRQLATASPILKADNPEAFHKALHYLTESYDTLDPKVSGWERQLEREVAMTGSDSLAMAYRDIHAHMKTLMHIEDDNDADARAVYVGLVDGMIFVDAYDAYRTGGAPLRPAS